MTGEVGSSFQVVGEALAAAGDSFVEEELPEIIRAVRSEQAAPAEAADLPTPTPDDIARKFGRS